MTTVPPAETAAVVIMAKAPQPGTVKTRLHPLLGPGQCAALQAELIRHTIELTTAAMPRTYLAVASNSDAHHGIPIPTTVRPLRQRGAHLGQRLAAAVTDVVADGAGPILVIGTDSPTLTEDHLTEAATALQSHDVVLGPAIDGGYYLIGMHALSTTVFGIAPDLWSTDQVLSATRELAGRHGLTVALLDPLRDLDTPEDAAALTAEPGLPPRIATLLEPEPVGVNQVSIIVPARNEEVLIGAALQRLRQDFPDCELIVADGDSTDATVELATPHATVVTSAAGRAKQMNAGARHATGTVLWFVHVDTVIDPDAVHQIHACLADSAVVGGGLTLGFDRRTAGLNYLARTSNLRARRLHHIFGDQAMFVRRTVFDALGGFPDLAIMEDLEFSRRLHRRGRLCLLPATATASSRRLIVHGTWRMILFMQYLKLLYFAGVDPEIIHGRYAAGPHLLPTRPLAAPDHP